MLVYRMKTHLISMTLGILSIREEEKKIKLKLEKEMTVIETELRNNIKFYDNNFLLLFVCVCVCASIIRAFLLVPEIY